jgi:hypothetical protein
MDTLPPLSRHEVASGIGSSELAFSRLGKEAPTVGKARQIAASNSFELVLGIVFQGETGASSRQMVNVIVTWGRAWFRSGSDLLGASCVVRRSAAALYQCRGFQLTPKHSRDLIPEWQ